MALRVAAEGEMAETRIASPTLIRPIMGFTRLSAAAYGRLRQAVDEDHEFRARVAESADEELLGRAGFLWLTRPDGWDQDPVFATSSHTGGGRGSGRHGGQGRKAREQSTVDEKVAKAREHADKAEQARKKAVEQRSEALAEVEQLRADLTGLSESVEALEAERNAAVRAQKALESKLSDVRRDLKLARAATREAEEELLTHKSAESGSWQPSGTIGARAGDAAKTTTKTASVGAQGASADHDKRPTPEPAPAAPTPGSGIDGAVARRAVDAAATAAADLARALAAAAAALDPQGGAPTRAAGAERSGPSSRRRPGAAPSATTSTGRRSGGAERRVGRRKRRAPSLPPGVFDDSPEARRHLVSDPHVQVVVDGYNLAREAWTGLEPEEERRRTVALLEETAVRSGAPVTVVFDGDDSAIAPAASRVVRVVFSSTGVTADDDIAAMLRTIPVEQPVLVVSSDRAVAADARSQGAAVLLSAEFLTAIGR